MMKTLIVNRKITLSIFVVMLLTCWIQGNSYAQNAPDDTIVEFIDITLAKAVRRALGLGTSQGVDLLKIPKAELEKLTELDASWSSIDITNLTGLEHATQLTELDLHSNNISDLTPLAQLTKLTTLDLASNNISDLTPLAQLTKLTTLDLASNNISDLTPLAQLTEANGR